MIVGKTKIYLLQILSLRSDESITAIYLHCAHRDRQCATLEGERIVSAIRRYNSRYESLLLEMSYIKREGLMAELNKAWSKGPYSEIDPREFKDNPTYLTTELDLL